MKTNAFNDTELMGGPIVEPRVLRSTAQLDREERFKAELLHRSQMLQSPEYEFQQSAQKEYNLGARLFALALVGAVIGLTILYFMPR